MKAKRIFFPEKGVAKFEEFDIPDTLGPKEVLVQAVSTLISTGTELNLFSGTHTIMISDDPQWKNSAWGKYPFRPGYSFSGIVKKIGSEVAEFKVSDRIFTAGSHATFLVKDVTKDIIFKIPDNVPFDDATFCALGAVAMRGVRAPDIKLGEAVVVCGLGIVGQLTVQVAKADGGMPVIAVDTINSRLEMAKKNGIKYGVNPKETDAVKAIKDITGGLGADVIIDSTGNPKTLPGELKFGAKNARVVILGSPHGKVEIDLYTEIHSEGMTIIGAHVNSGQPTVWTRVKNTKFFSELLSYGLVNTKSLITHKVKFAEKPDIFKILVENKTDYMGVILDWA